MKFNEKNTSPKTPCFFFFGEWDVIGFFTHHSKSTWPTSSDSRGAQKTTVSPAPSAPKKKVAAPKKLLSTRSWVGIEFKQTCSILWCTTLVLVLVLLVFVCFVVVYYISFLSFGNIGLLLFLYISFWSFGNIYVPLFFKQLLKTDAGWLVGWLVTSDCPLCRFWWMWFFNLCHQNWSNKLIELPNIFNGIATGATKIHLVEGRNSPN